MKVIGTDKNGNEIAEVSVTELDTMFKEIRAKAIDEFVERARILCINRPIGCDCRENIPLYAHTDGTWHDLFVDIAEAMKGVQ